MSYYEDRLATITSAAPAAPALPWPIGTRLALEGDAADEAGPWALVEVAGMFDNGPDAGGYEPVLRPIDIAAGWDCAPRKVAVQAIIDLGYEVAAEGEQAQDWETPKSEIAAPPFA